MEGAMIITDQLFACRNTRAVADVVARAAERTVAALADAHPLLLDKARLLAADARAVADAARRLQHAVEAELGPGYDDAT
jgi:hypothetical protein